MTEQDQPTETFQEEETFQYPPKPVLKQGEQSQIKSILSIVLFAAAFYFLFGWDWREILALIVVLAIHELGHYLAMQKFGYRNLGIFFIPLLGAAATGTKEKISQKQEIIVLLAGPVPGIIFGSIMHYIGSYINNEYMMTTANFFVVINLFNLLPVLPLDGGRILKNLFFKNSDWVNIIFMGISVIGFALFGLSTGGYTIFIIPFFLTLRIINAVKNIKIRKIIAKEGIDISKGYSELSDKEFWQTRDVIGKESPQLKNIITPGLYEYSPQESKVIAQIKDIIQNKPISDLSVSGKLLVCLIWGLSFVFPLGIFIIEYLTGITLF